MKRCLIPSAVCVALLLGSASASAQSASYPYGAWGGDSSFDRSDHPVLQQDQDEGIPSNRRVVELPGRDGTLNDISRRLKEDPEPFVPKAEPKPKPATEQAARDEFYRNLHRHADGVGTIEDVEGAYRELLPFRR
jgi:hypothetical protein